jgi:hypothetical protein
MASPVMSRMGWHSMPGTRMSTISAVMPSCLALRSKAVGSVRTRNSPHWAMWAVEIQILRPSSTYSSPSRRAEQRRLARSLPASGSEKPWHQCSSAERMPGSQRRCCSGVPHLMIMGPICQMPLALKMPGARALAISSE